MSRDAAGVNFSKKKSDKLSNYGPLDASGDNYWTTQEDASNAFQGDDNKKFRVTTRHTAIINSKKVNLFIAKDKHEAGRISDALDEKDSEIERKIEAARQAYGSYPPPSDKVQALFPGAYKDRPKSPAGTPVIVGAPNWEVDAANALLHYGVLVLKDKEFVDNKDAIKDAFNKSIEGMPEFTADYKKRARGNAPDTQFIHGGFAALGNASSFHNEFVRRLRQVAMSRVALVASKIAEFSNDPTEWVFEQIIDRMLYRASDFSPQTDAWHMDLPAAASKLKPKDEKLVFGGWYSVGRDQEFSCWPESHLHSKTDAQDGFNVLQPYQKDIANTHKVGIKVPAGHILIFDESIVHQVIKGPTIPLKQQRSVMPKETVRRVFLGWALRHGDKYTAPVIEEMDRLLDTQAVMPLKSGQIPEFYPEQPRTAFLIARFPKWREYAEAAIVPSLHVKWSMENGGINSKTFVWDLDNNGSLIPGEFTWKKKEYPYEATQVPEGSTVNFEPTLAPVRFPSLYDSGLGMYPEYRKDEKKIYFPNRKWNLPFMVEYIFSDDPTYSKSVKIRFPDKQTDAPNAAMAAAAAAAKDENSSAQEFAAASAAAFAAANAPSPVGSAENPYVF